MNTIRRIHILWTQFKYEFQTAAAAPRTHQPVTVPLRDTDHPILERIARFAAQNPRA